MIDGYPPVTVYGQPGCRPCKRTRALLDGAEIDYEYVDLTVNDDARTYVTSVLKASSVPVVVSDTHDPIIGYQPDKLRALIDHHRKESASGA